MARDSDPGELEPVVVRVSSLNEKIAEEMSRNGYEAEALPLGSTIIESSQSFSQMFGFGPRVVTNRGVIKVVGKYFDYVQVIQRS